jgi:beta-glucosidase/6-phospho-beta-glucosidase/beta-galactosidase
VVALSLLAACSSGGPAMPHSAAVDASLHDVGVSHPDVGAGDATPASLTFPAGFQWGVSISAEESEGGNVQNDWYAFEQMGRVPPAGMAQNFYNLYDTDFANCESMHLNSFQMTIEWARIVPNLPADPTKLTPADIDQAEVAHYHAVLASALAHHLNPVVTVTHYTFPKWFDNPAAYDTATNTFTDNSLGGFTSYTAAQALGAYAGFLAQEFGSQVQWWLSEDEPEDDLFTGYMTGTFPPGLTGLTITENYLPNGASASTVMQNMIAAHALAYRAIHAVQPDAHVSFAHNSLVFTPVNQDADTLSALTRLDHIYNLVFLDALTTGEFDSSLIGNGPMVSHPEWASSLDFVGVNYYDTNWVAALPGFLSPLDAIPCNGNFPTFLLTNAGCPLTNPPEIPGMTSIMLKYAQRYHLPLFVTESGTIATPERKSIFLVQVLKALHAAIQQGANVVGYSFWTLSYDYEWNDGYTQDMGLFDIKGFFGPDGGLPAALDAAVWSPGPSTDFTRVPLHPIVDIYTSVAGTNTLSGAYLAKYATDGGEWY